MSVSASPFHFVKDSPIDKIIGIQTSTAWIRVGMATMTPSTILSLRESRCPRFFFPPWAGAYSPTFDAAVVVTVMSSPDLCVSARRGYWAAYRVLAWLSRLAVSMVWFLMNPCRAGIITLLAIAGNASRSKNWLIDLAFAMICALFLLRSVNLEVSAPLAVGMFDESTDW